MSKEIKLTKEEEQAIEAKRVEDEKTKECKAEIEKVLEKYGRNLATTQPQIVLAVK